MMRSTLRKLKSNDTWRYKTFQMYKGTRIDPEQHEYRSCLAPSPTTGLAEAVILRMLATDLQFAIPPRVFSYRWPKHPGSGWSYEYFAAGYRERNSAIGAALEEDAGNVAVVADLKSFYPSVNTGTLLARLEGLLKKANGHVYEFRSEILDFMRQLVNTGGQGIPIGPSCGHFLGHIALRNVDRELQNKFGNRYFRYVDDLVLVVPKDSRRDALHAIIAAANQEGFSLNESKTVTLDKQRWESSVQAPDLQLDDSFSAFTSDLATYLAFHGGKADELKEQFLAEGFSVPVSRLLALSKYSRFRYFLLQRSHGGRLHAISVYFSDASSFVARAHKLRVAYEEKLQSFMDDGKAQEPDLNRWRLQRARRVVNVLFYLWAPSTWQSQMAIFDAFPELVEQRSLATALGKGDVGPILPFYGRGPAAFAELWNETATERATFQWPSTGLTDLEVESLVTLSLTGAIAEVPAAIALQQQESRILRLGAEDSTRVRTITDLSFEDEVESLALGVGRDQIAELVKSRYAIQETSVLDALALLGSEYRS